MTQGPRSFRITTLMKAVVDEVRAVVRSGDNEKIAFDALRELGAKHLPRRKWNNLRLPALFETDVLEAAIWIKDNVVPYRATNVFLALDTMNERDGQGKNVTSLITRSLDPSAELKDWGHACEGPKALHLVWGLFGLHQLYLKWDLEYPASVLVDYVIFLGYSGLMYAAAVERSCLKDDCRFVWGFGEDTPFPLVRMTSDGPVRLT
jgi:hypothetical protein